MTPEPWPEVADHEIALMAAEALWGAPAPDTAEEADMAAWRSEYADLLAKGPEAVMQEAAASNAEFDRQAEAERQAELEPENGTMTGPAARPQPQPSEPAPTDEPARDSFSGPAEAPDTWTADAAYPADSPIRYTLTPQAETLLGEDGNPTGLLRNGHACDMRAHDPQPGPGPSGQPRTYVTQISLPPSDSGIQRLHSRMKEPQPEPEAGL